MMTFLILIFAHLLGDFTFQSQYLATTKGNNVVSLIAHSGIWTGTILIAAYLIGYEINMIDVWLLLLIHALADYVKAKPIGFYKELDPLGAGLVLDQIIHVGQIILFMIYKS